MADEIFEPQVHNEGEPGGERFEVWVRGVCVARSDHECYVNVYIDGDRVFSMEADIEYDEGEAVHPRPEVLRRAAGMLEMLMSDLAAVTFGHA